MGRAFAADSMGCLEEGEELEARRGTAEVGVG
jgi:hypothetical protein